MRRIFKIFSEREKEVENDSVLKMVKKLKYTRENTEVGDSCYIEYKYTRFFQFQIIEIYCLKSTQDVYYENS